MTQRNAADRVAEEVRSMAARKRYSQTRIAAVLGCSQASVSRLFRGEVAFDVNQLDTLAAEWDLPITDLIPARETGSRGTTSGWSGRIRQGEHAKQLLSNAA